MAPMNGQAGYIRVSFDEALSFVCDEILGVGKRVLCKTKRSDRDWLNENDGEMEQLLANNKQRAQQTVLKGEITEDRRRIAAHVK